MLDYFVKSCSFKSSFKISNNKAQVIKNLVAERAINWIMKLESSSGPYLPHYMFLKRHTPDRTLWDIADPYTLCCCIPELLSDGIYSLRRPIHFISAGRKPLRFCPHIFVVIVAIDSHFLPYTAYPAISRQERDWNETRRIPHFKASTTAP